MTTRIKANVLLRRYISGGLTGMLGKRPITEREKQKTLANPPTRHHWATLCMDPDHAAAFEKLMAEP